MFTNILLSVFMIFVIKCTLFLQTEALPNQPYQEYCPPEGYDSSKKCSVRGNYVSQPIWNHISGFYCYIYTNKARFSKKYTYYTNYLFNCNGTNLSLPVAIVNDYTIALYDYKNTASAELLRNSFKTQDFFDNYIKCCKDAEKCCAKLMTNENIISDQFRCPVVWDAWSCFPLTPVGTTATLPCSSQAYQSPDKVCTLESNKVCYKNQTTGLAEWNQQTDYSTCTIAPVYLRRHNYHVTALYVCTAFSFPAIVIFLVIPVFRETTRVILHRNLLVAIVVRNIFTILAKKIVIIDALLSSSLSNHVMESNSVLCRILSFFMSAATNATYACMLVDGYYLHKVIVRTFAREPSLVTLYIVVTVLTFLPSIIWASIVAANERTSCWMVDTNGEQWSVDSFRVAILSINTVLLLDIIRIMISKMKQGGPTRQTKAAFRATLFLIPLFGLHIFITAKKVVVNDSCLAEDVYDYFRYTMEASQGIFVALLFCYANSEVHTELKNAFRKIAIRLNQRFGWEFGRFTKSTKRRTTTATYVAPRGSINEF
ncbi:corticotropin-releasing factor receptor 2-like isoform X2 [Anthonomus grandis grandis]|uniref:corticotropin-releasing factor receptor 2-like isoform X2 n=1 Tax=Anthonomus grandis grandis TaxID=2921223 RepID=UPI0021667E1E|nr:corticotropin-releasing factor receptor 2-like isoform X2 [Anthonomus grandis grandis]